MCAKSSRYLPTRHQPVPFYNPDAIANRLERRQKMAAANAERPLPKTPLHGAENIPHAKGTPYHHKRPLNTEQESGYTPDVRRNSYSMNNILRPGPNSNTPSSFENTMPGPSPPTFLTSPYDIPGHDHIDNCDIPGPFPVTGSPQAYSDHDINSAHNSNSGRPHARMSSTGPTIIPPNPSLQNAISNMDPELRAHASQLCQHMEDARRMIDQNQRGTEASQRRSANAYHIVENAHSALLYASSRAEQQGAITECQRALAKLAQLQLESISLSPDQRVPERSPRQRTPEMQNRSYDASGPSDYGQTRSPYRASNSTHTPATSHRYMSPDGYDAGYEDIEQVLDSVSHHRFSGGETVGQAIDRLREELMRRSNQQRIDQLSDDRLHDIMVRLRDLEQRDRNAPYISSTPLPAQPAVLEQHHHHHHHSSGPRRHRRRRHSKHGTSTPYPATSTASPWTTAQHTYPYQFNNDLAGSTPRAPSPVIPYTEGFPGDSNDDESSRPVSRKICSFRRLLRRIRGAGSCSDDEVETDLPGEWGGNRRNPSQQIFTPHPPFGSSSVGPVTPFGTHPSTPFHSASAAPLSTPFSANQPVPQSAVSSAPIVSEMATWYKFANPGLAPTNPGPDWPFHSTAFTPNTSWAPVLPPGSSSRTPWIAPAGLACTPVVLYNPIPTNASTGQPARQVFPSAAPLQWEQAYAACGGRPDFVYDTVFPAFSRYSSLRPPLEIDRHIVLNPTNCLDPNVRWNLTQNPRAVGRCLAKSSRGLLSDASSIFSRKAFTTLDEKHLQNIGVQQVQLFAEPGQEMLFYMMTHHWGPIVLPRKLARDVTIGDVIESVYAYLREPLTTPEHAAIVSNSKRAAEDIRSWRMHRLATQSELEMEMTKSVCRRIDAMGHDRFFMGLRQEVFEDGQWTIRVSFGRGLGQY